ncbi:MAG: carbohydrate kinase family protein, partial [Mesorhizobium sp.]
FNAAFLAALAQGRPLKNCLSAAIKVASRAISTLPRDYGGQIQFEDADHERA